MELQAEKSVLRRTARNPLEGNRSTWGRPGLPLRGGRPGDRRLSPATAFAALVSAAALVAVLSAPSCAGNGMSRAVQGTELREYNGETLESVRKFEENSIRGPQYVDISKYRLKISGLVDRPAELTYDEVLALPSRLEVVTTHCVEGWEVKTLWEGVPLTGLFAQAGVKPEATTVIFKCFDGYSTSLTTDYIKAKNVVLAYKVNGIPLPPDRGYPFAVVAEDKWGYKSARWVTSIELSTNAGFRGYWERRGYNNNGDLKGSMFERRP
jgi:DMSO/TMAO reductase YedYZ molybdopterin-dependent catalytic subunit